MLERSHYSETFLEANGFMYSQLLVLIAGALRISPTFDYENLLKACNLSLMVLAFIEKYVLLCE